MDGILVVNKPSGLSSNDVGQKVKRMLALKKIGHLGTLDPLATGVLPLCINEGTKLVQFLVETEKEYIATLQLGVETDTQDIQGAVLNETDDICRDKNAIIQAVMALKGEIFQTPPMFSALKHNGVPLYKLARKGMDIPRKPRKVVIHDVEVLSIDCPYVVFRVVCSHGTYVRTLCHDIGRELLCGGCLVRLERVRTGVFHIGDCVSMEDFSEPSCEDLIAKHLISPKDALAGLPEIIADNGLVRRIRNGTPVTVHDLTGIELPKLTVGQKIKIVYQDSLIGVVECLVDDEKLHDYEPDTKAWKICRVFIN